ncbi:hypothetical protein Tco_1091659 [Tanacetum coccineum]|uniref:Uncharacterized protein n=1 Tax=Tanacetum coccineum TaxID=301880 RepID=A0ABQ5I7S7_9ASTR
MTNNINHFKELVDQAWEKHSHNHFCALTALDMEVLIKTCLMPLSIKTQNDSFTFVHELKQEIHADLKYAESLRNEINKLEYDKAEFSNMYDILFQECVSNDVMCSYLHSLSDLDAHVELQCLYVHKVKEYECIAQKLSKQTKTVSKEVYNELSRSFAKLEKHSISLELALQQYLKAQLHDKNIAISELKKLIEKMKGKSVDTNFEKQSILGKQPLQPIRNQPVVGLKWIPIRKSVETRYNTNDCSSPLGKKSHNPNTTICANSYSLSAGGSSKLNLPDHRYSIYTVKRSSWNWRYKRQYCGLIPAGLDSLPHAHAQTTKTYYKHQDLRIKKAQVLKTRTSTNYDIKDSSSKIKLWGRLLKSFQEDAKYEHVSQDTRSQGGKDDQDIQGKDLKISKSKMKSKDNDKG